MTGQELADAIRAEFSIDLKRTDVTLPEVQRRLGSHLIEFLAEHPPVAPEPPCTIDKVPGWTVHTDANGDRFAFRTGYGAPVKYEVHQTAGVQVDDVVHPWPDPPRYQPGDLVDVYPAEISVTTSKWTHLGRTFIGLMSDGRVVVSLPDAANPVAWPPERVRPHVEGTA